MMDSNMMMLLMKISWLGTALGSIRLGAMALDMDYLSQYKQVMKIVDICIGVLGVYSLVMFFMHIMQS